MPQRKRAEVQKKVGGKKVGDPQDHMWRLCETRTFLILELRTFFVSCVSFRVVGKQLRKGVFPLLIELAGERTVPEGGSGFSPFYHYAKKEKV